MLGLVDFLQASGVSIDNRQRKTKVHLACWNGEEHPVDVYYAGEFEAWQQHQTKRNFESAQILSLIDRGQGRWLFAGVYESLGCKPHPKVAGHFLYSTRLLPGQDDLIGRVIVAHKRSRASYIWLKPSIALPIVEIRPEKLSIAEFPGYNWVSISHDNLKTVIKQRVAAWHAALANVKGVYLITDTSTGEHYVGKASGNEGIWDRWSAYANNGHGGNVNLRSLLKMHGPEHKRHFQYSVLEIADTHASDQDILARESYWMSVLKTREFGLN